MSEQNTSNPKTIAMGTKVKDPRRVASGKRLGAISKQAKEAKRLERERQAQAQEAQQNAEMEAQEAQQNAEMEAQEAQQNAEMEADNNKTLYFVGGLLVVGVAYYSYLNKEKVVRTLTGNKEESDPASEQEPTPKKENFKSVFDD